MKRNVNLERHLTDDERILIKALAINTYKESEIVSLLPKYIVKDMDDGGMGSLKFIYKNSTERQIMGSTLVGGEFRDVDGVLVSVTINLDKLDKVYELDVWKIDFEPLIRYPKPEEIDFSYTTLYPLRNLNPEESALIKALVSGTDKEAEVINKLSNYIVRDLNIEGQESLEFMYKDGKERLSKRVLASATFLDDDGVSVDVTIDLDQYDNLYKLNICKSDYSALKRFPKPENITILKP